MLVHNKDIVLVAMNVTQNSSDCKGDVLGPPKIISLPSLHLQRVRPSRTAIALIVAAVNFGTALP